MQFVWIYGGTSLGICLGLDILITKKKATVNSYYVGQLENNTQSWIIALFEDLYIDKVK